MLALALLATLTAPVTPTVPVKFPAGETVTVTGPTNRDDASGWSPPWTPAETLLSPRGDAAAVRFCWDAIKYHGCTVSVVRPNGTVIPLKNSNVVKLLWTPDGKYLIGAGENTVRLWNLVGSVRAHVPRLPAVPPGMFHQALGIRSLRVEDRFLCVTVASDLIRKAGWISTPTTTTFRYAVPSLKLLGSVTTPTSEFEEAPCRLPVTEP